MPKRRVGDEHEGEGAASTQANVLLFLAALEKCLADQGYRFQKGANVAAALKDTD